MLYVHNDKYLLYLLYLLQVLVNKRQNSMCKRIKDFEYEYPIMINGNEYCVYEKRLHFVGYVFRIGTSYEKSS